MAKKSAKSVKPEAKSFTVTIGRSLLPKFLAQAAAAGHRAEEHIEVLVDNGVAVDQLADAAARQKGVEALANLVRGLPGVEAVGHSQAGSDFWWVKFSIDRRHPLAWHVVQRLGYVLNYYSLEHRFATVFMPVSPPPALNGGPEFLSWVIEAKLGLLDPRPVVKALRGALPAARKSEKAWREYDGEGKGKNPES